MRMSLAQKKTALEARHQAIRITLSRALESAHALSDAARTIATRNACHDGENVVTRLVRAIHEQVTDARRAEHLLLEAQDEMDDVEYKMGHRRSRKALVRRG